MQQAEFQTGGTFDPTTEQYYNTINNTLNSLPSSTLNDSILTS